LLSMSQVKELKMERSARSYATSSLQKTDP
jgi:hypothetical protein